MIRLRMINKENNEVLIEKKMGLEKAKKLKDLIEKYTNSSSIEVHIVE